MKFSINDFFSKCGQIRRKLWIWSHLLKKSVMENFIFCAVILYYFIILSLATTLTKNYGSPKQPMPRAILMSSKKLRAVGSMHVFAPCQIDFVNKKLNSPHS